MPTTQLDVQTSRLRVHTRSFREAGVAVVFVHGNCSSGYFFDALMQKLPDGFRGLSPDLRGYGDTEPKPIDATRGLKDHADDVWSLLDALKIDRAILVGHSMGGGVVMQMTTDQPKRVMGLLLESPVSPYGFGGTRDDGSPVWPDFAGSGGGTANPEFTKLLAAKDRSADTQVSPRNVMNGTYFKPPFKPADEDAMLDSVLSTRVADAHYPGPSVPSPNWPGVGPGETGINNSFSPKYMNLTSLLTAEAKPEVLWVRGDADVIVSDTSLFDLGHLGVLGLVPGWPGLDVYPPQKMVTQMRNFLAKYGPYREEVIADTGHSPHLEKPQAFEALALPFFGKVASAC